MITLLFFKHQFKAFKDAIIHWIVYCHIIFYQIENNYFHDLLFLLLPKLKSFLPKATNILHKWVRDAFETRKEKLHQDMQEAHSKISILFNLWTLPNYLVILGAIAYFINKTGKYHIAILALKEVKGKHSSKNMANVLFHIFNNYRITEQ